MDATRRPDAAGYARSAAVEELNALVAGARVDEFEAVMDWAMGPEFAAGMSGCAIDADEARLVVLSAVSCRLAGLDDFRVRARFGRPRKILRLVHALQRHVAAIEERRGAVDDVLASISPEKFEECSRRVRRDNRAAIGPDGTPEDLPPDPPLNSRAVVPPAPVSAGLGSRLARRRGAG